MSTILNEAAICALKEAYNSYMKRNRNDFSYYLQVAEKTVDAIRHLDKGPNRLGCDLELLCLSGELTLMRAFAYLDNPHMLLEQYKHADSLCVLQPSRVLNRELPYLPSELDIALMLADSTEDEKQAEKDCSAAIALYSKITDGGGIGVDYLFGAAYAFNRKDFPEANRLVQKARELGGEWIIPHVEKLLNKIEKEKKQYET